MALERADVRLVARSEPGAAALAGPAHLESYSANAIHGSGREPDENPGDGIEEPQLAVRCGDAVCVELPRGRDPARDRPGPVHAENRGWDRLAAVVGRRLVGRDPEIRPVQTTSIPPAPISVCPSTEPFAGETRRRSRPRPVTQRSPPKTAIRSAATCSPPGIVDIRTTPLVAGSIRSSVFSRWFRTHTKVPSNANPAGPLPTAMRATCAFVPDRCGSGRVPRRLRPTVRRRPPTRRARRLRAESQPSPCSTQDRCGKRSSRGARSPRPRPRRR